MVSSALQLVVAGSQVPFARLQVKLAAQSLCAAQAVLQRTSPSQAKPLQPVGVEGVTHAPLSSH